MRVFRKRERWWIDYREPDGQRRRRAVSASRREAEAALEKVRASILAGTYYGDHQKVERIQASELTLAQLWNEFEAGRVGISPSTRKDERIRFEKVILPFFGKKTTLGALTPASIAKYVRWRLDRGLRVKRGVSKPTVSRELSILRSMWKWGAKFLPHGVPPSPIPRNSEFKLPYENPGRIDFFTPVELETLLAEARSLSRDRLLPAAALGAFAGLREGEIVQLRWTDVDLDSMVLHVRNYTSGESQARTKNEENRVVPIRPRLGAILREVQDLHLATGGLPELVMPPNRRGKPIRSFYGAWARLLKRCGMRHRRIHDLRHTCASHMVMAGIPLLSVARFLGHKSTRVTERYAHLAPEHLTDEMLRVERWHSEGASPGAASKKPEGRTQG